VSSRVEQVALWMLRLLTIALHLPAAMERVRIQRYLLTVGALVWRKGALRYIRWAASLLLVLCLTLHAPLSLALSMQRWPGHLPHRNIRRLSGCRWKICIRGILSGRRWRRSVTRLWRLIRAWWWETHCWSPIVEFLSARVTVDHHSPYMLLEGRRPPLAVISVVHGATN